MGIMPRAHGLVEAAVVTQEGRRQRQLSFAAAKRKGTSRDKLMRRAWCRNTV